MQHHEHHGQIRLTTNNKFTIMKKLICIFLLLMCGIVSYAQKQYVIVSSGSGYKDITGVIPDAFVDKLKEVEANSYLGYVYDDRKEFGRVTTQGIDLATILNFLAEDGYEIDKTLVLSDGTEIIMSRTKPQDTASGNKTPQKGDVNEDGKIDISDIVSVINIIAKE